MSQGGGNSGGCGPADAVAGGAAGMAGMAMDVGGRGATTMGPGENGGRDRGGAGGAGTGAGGGGGAGASCFSERKPS